MAHNIWNRVITKDEMNNLKIDMDGESLTIYHDTEDCTDTVPVVYWHLDEVEEDANVAISMCNAVHLYHTNRTELLTKLNYKIVD